MWLSLWRPSGLAGSTWTAIREPAPGGVIGLNVNGLMVNGGYTRKNMFGLKLDYPSFLAAMIKALLAEHQGELWLVPHTYAPPGDVESDPEACCKVRAALPEILQHGACRNRANTTSTKSRASSAV